MKSSSEVLAQVISDSFKSGAKAHLPAMPVKLFKEVIGYSMEKQRLENK